MNVISAKKAWLHFQPRNNKRGRRCTVFHNSERRLAMETNAVEKPTIRFLKNFIVEENLAAVSWRMNAQPAEVWQRSRMTSP